MNISEAFALYEYKELSKRVEKTRKNYRTSGNSIMSALGDMPIELLSEDHLELWEQYMRVEGLSGTTRRGYLMDARCVLRYLSGKGYRLMDVSKIKLPENDTAPRPWLAPEKIERLIAAAKNSRDRAIIACTFLSGCRISEILDLDRQDIEGPVDAAGLQEVTVRGKKGKYRQVVFNETARYYLREYLGSRADNYRELFVSGQNRRITVSRVEQIVHQCARDAGLDEVVTPHILRHSFATDLLMNGAPLYEVSKSMGHANIAVTSNIYGHYDTLARKQTLLRHQSRLKPAH